MPQPELTTDSSVLADKADEEHVQKFSQVNSTSIPATPLPKIVRLVHIALAAQSREVPGEIRNSLLSTLHALLAGPDVIKMMATSCLNTIQVLLLIGMNEDLNGPEGSDVKGAVWRNIGSALRMAFSIVRGDEGDNLL